MRGSGAAALRDLKAGCKRDLKVLGFRDIRVSGFRDLSVYGFRVGRDEESSTVPQSMDVRGNLSPQQLRAFWRFQSSKFMGRRHSLILPEMTSHCRGTGGLP